MDTCVYFTDFHIREELLKAIQNMGFEKPSDVQTAVIPVALDNKDVLVQAHTGTGKTLAFGIPIVEKVETDKRSIQAVVLVPTRELAIQVAEEITKLGRFKRIRCVAIYGGQPVDVQKRILNQRVHIVVGTPGRMLDHITRNNIRLMEVNMLVLDEVDKMFDLGLVKEVEAIIQAIPMERQTMMFSATVKDKTTELVDKYLSEPQFISLAPQQVVTSKIQQWYCRTDEGAKFATLIHLLAYQGSGAEIVFCRTRSMVQLLTEKLRNMGYIAMGLHGDMTQDKRLEVIRGFKHGDYNCLIATDVAARGLDINDVTLVINYDIPLEAESYVHRIGRTGRTDNEGTAITLVTENEFGILGKIEDFIGQQIPPKELILMGDTPYLENIAVKSKPMGAEVNAKLGTYDNEITRLHIRAGRKNKLRPTDIVGAITAATGLSSDVIGIIEIYDTYSFVDIISGHGERVLEAMQNTSMKGRRIKVERANPVS